MRVVVTGGRAGVATVREWRLDDAEALATAWSDPEVRRWLAPAGVGVEAASQWIAGARRRREDAVALDLVMDVDGQVAGEVGFSSFDPSRRACLVGYWLLPRFRGTGMAAAVVGATARRFMAVTAGRAVLATCDPANRASWRTAEAAGFAPLGTHDAMAVYAVVADPPPPNE